MGYRIEGFDGITEYRGGNRVEPVREYHVVSLPSETYFQFRRGKRGGSWIDPKATAKALSDRIEAVHGIATVADILYSQDVTAGGKLQDRMTTFYRTADGSISGSVESSLAEFGPGFTGNQIAAEIASGGDVIG
jgi:hypothetical protein